MTQSSDAEIDEQVVRFGVNMRAARKRAGMSQVGLADGAELDRAAVSFLERAMRSPDLPTVLRIARACGVKPGALLRDIGTMPSPAGGPRYASPTPASRFGTNLRWARKRARLSQETLASEARVDRAAISIYERGHRAPNLRTILKLARALKLRPSFLLRGVE